MEEKINDSVNPQVPLLKPFKLRIDVTRLISNFSFNVVSVIFNKNVICLIASILNAACIKIFTGESE